MKTLILVEKESAGERISEFLDCESRNGHWESSQYIVVAERGHLLNMWLSLRGKSLSDLPETDVFYRIPKRSREKTILIQKLYRECDDIIVATDFDREGEVIGGKMVDYLLNQKNALHNVFIANPRNIQRVYFSALIDSELKRAFNNIMPMREGLLTKGLARNYADAVVGLNLTKALTIIFKMNFDSLRQAMSMGRVQSPLLAHINKRTSITYNKQCKPFESKERENITYIETLQGDIQVPLKVVSDEVELQSYETIKFKHTQAQHFPDTATIQSELPFSPEYSMHILESLYLKGYSTYPRTHSHYLPKEFINQLVPLMDLKENFNSNNCLKVEGDHELPHWAISLTPEGIIALRQEKLKGGEKIVAEYLFTKICRAIAPPLEIEELQAKIRADSQIHTIKWGQTCKNVEDAIGHYSFKYNPQIPLGKYRIKKVNSIKTEVVSLDEAFKPEINVFTNKDLVKWMNEVGIGTEATRHTFPLVLQQRNYTDNQNLTNRLGNVVSSIIETIGLDTNLTSEMENKIESITHLSELEDFMQWTTFTTQNMLKNLRSINKEIVFTCPKGHNVKLINTRKALLLRCDTCKKWYTL